MKSWKTSVSGSVAALGVYFANQTDPTLHIIGQVLTAVGTFLTGLFARDNNVTSEQAGAAPK